MKKISITLLVTFFIVNVYTQNKRTIDSLKQVIKTAKHDTSRISAYLAWGEQIYLNKPDSAFILWQKAQTLAENLLASHPLTIVADMAKKQLTAALNNIGYIYQQQGDIPRSLEFYSKGLKIQEEIGDKKGMASSFNNIGIIYNNLGDIPKALEYYGNGLKIQEEIGDKQGMASSFNNIGYIYNMQGDIPKALEYYSKSLKIREEIGDKKGMANSFNNIGVIYDDQGDIPKALEYHGKSLKLNEEIGDKQGMANSFNNIGYIYQMQGALPKALEYLGKSLKIREEIGDKKGMAYSFNSIGYIYNEQGDIPKTLEYLGKSLKIREEIGDKQGMAYSFNNIGAIYFAQNNMLKAKSCYEKSYRLSKELGYPENIERAASGLKKIYEKQGNYQLAYEYYKEEVLMHDSIQNQENYKKTMHQQAKYEYEKQKAVDSIAHTKAMEIKNLEIKRQEAVGSRQRIVIWFVVCGLLLVVVFSGFLFRLFMQKKKANRKLAQQNIEIQQKNEEITVQRDEIEAQRDKLSEQNTLLFEQKKEITDSINYAKRIQQAMLPDLAKCFITHMRDETFIDHFVLFKPKAVVSGDFYWAAIVETRNVETLHATSLHSDASSLQDAHKILVVAVVDCTGHGVPGAFMSMLGISFLNEIVRKKEVTKASEVLDHLRESVTEALQQKGQTGEQKDGMDMSLVAINLTPIENLSALVVSPASCGIELCEAPDRVCERYTLQFAGANNPLYIIQSVAKQPIELKEISPDKMPVAIHIKMENFTNYEITLNTGDKLYLFSDGFPDQFGGPKGKKFKYSAFKKLIAETSNLSMKEQSEQIEMALENWMNYEGKSYEQIDDITVVGLKI